MTVAQFAVRFAAVALALTISALSFLGAQVGAQPAIQGRSAAPLHPSTQIARPAPGAEADAVTEMAQRAALGLPRLTAQ